jgi:SnoaL-like domain
MTDLETRIRQLEDLEAIRRLKHYYYCHCVDRTVAGDTQAAAETVSRFADDIVADFTGLPPLDGKEAVSEFYAQGVPAFLSWCQHRVMNEVIDIDGDVATADWYVDCPAVFREGNPSGIVGSGFIAGRYHEVYARVDGIWMWQRITALLDVQAAADDHWVEASFVRVNR